MEQAVFTLDDVEPRKSRGRAPPRRLDFLGLGGRMHVSACGGYRCSRAGSRRRSTFTRTTRRRSTFSAARGSRCRTTRAHEVRPGDCIVHREGGEARASGGDEGLDVLAFGVSRQAARARACPRVGVTWFGALVVRHRAGEVAVRAEAELGPPESPSLVMRPGSILNVDELEARDMASGAPPRHVARDWVRGRREARRVESHRARARADGRPAALPRGRGGAVRRPRWRRDAAARRRRASCRAFRHVARPAGTGVAHAFPAGDGGLTFLAYGPRAERDRATTRARTRSCSGVSASSAAGEGSTTGTARRWRREWRGGDRGFEGWSPSSSSASTFSGRWG